MAPGEAPTSHHGKPDFVRRSIAAAEAFGISHEILGSAEIRRRFPLLAGATDDVRKSYEPGEGHVRTERCVAAQLLLAERHGAEICVGEAVNHVRQVGRGVEVTTSSGILRAQRAAAAAGAWAGPLLGPPFSHLLTVSRQVLHCFETEAGAEFGARPPVFI